METMNTSPEISKRKLERRSAMQEVFDKVESLVGVGAGSKERFEASKKYLEEVVSKNIALGKEAKNVDARLEEAIAKLVEFYELELEVENREGELEGILPGIKQRMAANDSHFLDKKYNV